jgi:hypothetical protein
MGFQMASSCPNRHGDTFRTLRSSSTGHSSPREDWIPFTVPTILEDKYLFEKVQKILENNQKFACKKRKHEYLLSGVIYCECGNRRVGDGIDKENFYYRCAERIYKFPVEKKCKSQGINAVALDKSLWNELMSFLTDPKKLKEATEKWLLSESNNNSQSQEKAKIEVAIESIKEEKQRYAKAYGAKTLEFDQLKDLVNDANRREQVQVNALNELNKKINQRSLNGVEVEKICFEVEKILKTMDFTNKFQVIKDIITKITVKGGQEVGVKGRLPLFALNMGYETISRNCGASQCW